MMKKLVMVFIFSIYSLGVVAFDKISCEQSHHILKHTGFEKHFVNFVNFAYMFKGRCRGHSLMTQKTFYLMEFDKGDNPFNCSTENFPIECEKFFYDKIASVFFDGKVVDIPGFKNLIEFSKNSYIEGLLKYHVSRTPVTFKTLEAKNRFLSSEKNPSVAHFKEAVQRIQEFQIPYIAISSHWTGDHAVLGHKVIKGDKGLKLCVRDPNLIPNRAIDCENYFYIDKLETKLPGITDDQSPQIKTTDEVFYHKRGEETDKHLFKVRIYSEEDTRTKSYIKARVEYCQQQN